MFTNSLKNDLDIYQLKKKCLDVYTNSKKYLDVYQVKNPI